MIILKTFEIKRKQNLKNKGVHKNKQKHYL